MPAWIQARGIAIADRVHCVSVALQATEEETTAMESLDWRQQLKAARRALGTSRASLALMAGVSEATVKAYELGRRRPSRKSLEAILDALKLDAARRNKVLAAVGFLPVDTLFSPERSRGYFYTVDEAANEIERQPWPACVVNDVMEVGRQQASSATVGHRPE